MSARDREDLFGKGIEAWHRLIAGINPLGEEGLIELVFLGGSDIAGICQVRDHKHLQARVNPAEFPFPVIFLNLAKGILERTIGTFELNLNHGQAVDQERHI